MSKLLKDGPFVLSFATHTMILVLQLCEQDDFETTIIQVCILHVRVIYLKKSRNKKEKMINKCIGMHGGYTS